MPFATMYAIASVVIIGFTPEAVGKVLESAMYRPDTSQHWPLGSHTDVLQEQIITSLHGYVSIIHPS